MVKVKGANLFTKLIAEYSETPLEEAVKIHNYIDQWFQIDWSEATNKEIEATIETAIKLMSNNTTGEQ